MSTFMLPYVSKKFAYIEPNFSFEEISPIIISKSLHNYLLKLKDNIDEVQKDWDIYKRYTNPYECLHSQSFGQASQPVCPVKPISRSYFKMIEMCDIFDIVGNMPDAMNSFHIAEGPGGFIEALSHLRMSPEDTYVGITLLSENPNVPGWRKSQAFLANNPNVIIENGADRTGDITKEENLLYCAGKYGATMDLVTADGGFDFSGDFNHQENQIGLLLVSQLAMATAVQKQGGIFIMKLFDIFTKLSIDIVYLISMMYEKVHIVKPNTSRYANSERYIVAQGFKSDDGRRDWVIQFAPILDKIPTRFKNEINVKSEHDVKLELDTAINDDINKEIENVKMNANILSLINEEIPRYFITRIEESNASIGQQQLDVISNTLSMIRNPRQDKMEKMRIISIQRCVLWCQKHKLPYNRDVRHFNMFLSAKNKVSRLPRKRPDENVNDYELELETKSLQELSQNNTEKIIDDICKNIVETILKEQE